MPHSVVAMEGEGHHHVVIVTVPCPGHIIPAAQVAKYLLALGIRVSCFSTGMNYPSVEHNLLENLHGQRIQFRPLIDASEFVSPGKEITDNIGWMQAPSDGEMTTRLNNILKTLTPPPQCIISDLLVGWTQDVADGLHIPHHVIYTMPANALLFSFGCIPSLLSPEVAPVHPPGTWNSMVDTTHAFHDYMIRNTKRLPEAAMILVNTFEALEEEFLRLLRTDLIGKSSVQIESILSIGPLIRSSVSDEVRDPGEKNPIASSDKKIPEAAYVEVIMQWLDAQEQSTVLYVSFGSLLTVTEEQIHELAHGLEISGRPFLWVYRAPNAPQVLPTEADDAVLNGLPAGFMERVEGQGKLIHGWAPQEKILAHESVGGFMSHCGWNSTLEALWAGKPIAAWPLAVEQRLNARYLANNLKIAVEVCKDDNGMVARGEVVRAISVLMDDKEMRSRFLKMQEQAHLALKEGSSSELNLKILVDSIKCHPIQEDRFISGHQ